jgi:hypothetical protein
MEGTLDETMAIACPFQGCVAFLREGPVHDVSRLRRDRQSSMSWSRATTQLALQVCFQPDTGHR